MTILVVAVAGRALAAAAQRAGEAVIVADFFGDLDTRARAPWVPLAGDLEHGIASGQFAALGAALPERVDGIVYGSGFERDPRLLGELSGIAPLLGNPPEVVARVKDPGAFAALLGELGLPTPRIADRLPPGRDWLRKRRGGAGGTHIAWGDGPAVGDESEVYYQEWAPGRPVSALFVADGRDTRVLGFSEQWVSPAPGAPFRFGGCAAPAVLSPAVASALEHACGAIARPTQLVGLNSLDALVDDDAFTILEVNPRPGATLDILDGNGAPLWRLHLDGVAGRLPHAPPRGPSRARASAIAYATGALRVPRSFRWPEWAADRAAPLSLAPPGAPVCTALAEAATASGARDLACRRAAAVVSHFEACMASSGTPL